MHTDITLSLPHFICIWGRLSVACVTTDASACDVCLLYVMSVHLIIELAKGVPVPGIIGCRSVFYNPLCWALSFTYPLPSLNVCLPFLPFHPALLLCPPPLSLSVSPVMLQPFDPNSTDKNKHKFMVQTMFAPPDFSPEQLDVIVSHIFAFSHFLMLCHYGRRKFHQE